MRIAHYSPLPPARTGIADYSAALVEQLGRLAEVESFASAEHAHRPAAGTSIAVYQLGNNPHHDFVYEAAVKNPGVAVLHEANLHHLVVHLTLARGKTEAYWREVVLNGGGVGSVPDYKIPMLRTLLTRSRAAIVHSAEVEAVLRAHGFERPIRRIPHGASALSSEICARLRAIYRARLGIDDSAPVFGVFGFLKPYKRIAQAQRAFRRLVREIPDATMILVGERDPGVVIESAPYLRHIDFAPIDDFNGYVAACDAVINLRYPTVGETSGTLTRAMAMGKPAIVTDTGSFREYPEHTCLRVPADPSEEDVLFEYLKLLARRPDVREAIGTRAHKWIEVNCSWESVARRYADFIADVSGEHVRRWVPAGGAARDYARTHGARLQKTLAVTPPGRKEDAVLEMGTYLQIAPALTSRLGYGKVRGCYFGPRGRTDHRSVTLDSGESFQCEVDHFDAERDVFPYGDGAYRTVLCCELLEHLQTDPMHMMAEIHRILKPGGHLVLTTPNIASLRSVAGILQGFHPMLFPAFLHPNKHPPLNGDARHSREYTPREISALLENSGFEVTLLESGPFREMPRPELGWIRELFLRNKLSSQHPGDGIYAVGRKVGRIRSRYPEWLYA